MLLTTIARILLRRWFLIALCAALGGTCAFLYSRSIPTLYEAVVQVRVPIVASNFVNNGIVFNEGFLDDPKLQIYRLTTSPKSVDEIRNLCYSDQTLFQDNFSNTVKFSEPQAVRGIMEIRVLGTTSDSAIECAKLLYERVQLGYEQSALSYERDALARIELLKSRIGEIEIIAPSKKIKNNDLRTLNEYGEADFLNLQIFILRSAILDAKIKKLSLVNPIFISNTSVKINKSPPISFGIFLGLIFGALFFASISLILEKRK